MGLKSYCMVLEGQETCNERVAIVWRWMFDYATSSQCCLRDVYSRVLFLVMRYPGRWTRAEEQLFK